MRRIELTTIKFWFATTESSIIVRTAVELRMCLLRPHLRRRGAPPHRPLPLLRGIGERTGARATHKDRGGAAHDGTRGRHTLLCRLEVVGVPSLPPALSLPIVSSLRSQSY
jgi:hypothetical protein